MGVFQQLQGVSFPNTLPLLVKDPLVTVGTLHLIDTLRATSWDGSVPVNGDVFNDLSVTGTNDGTFSGTGGATSGNAGIVFDGAGTNVPRINLPDIPLHNKSFVLAIWVKPVVQLSGTLSYFGRALSDSVGQFNLKKLANATNTLNVRFMDSIGNFTLLGYGVSATVPTQIAFSVEITGPSTTVVKLFKDSVLFSTGERAQGNGLIEYTDRNPAIFGWSATTSFDDMAGTFYRSLIEDLGVSGRTPEEVLALDYATNVARFS